MHDHRYFLLIHVNVLPVSLGVRFSNVPTIHLQNSNEI